MAYNIAVMGEIRWYLQWLFLGLIAICIVVLAIRFSTLVQRVPLAAASRSLVSSTTAQSKADPAAQRKSTGAERSRSDKAGAGDAVTVLPAQDGATTPADEQSWRYRKTARPTVAVTQGKLNINSASLEELVALPGIGPKLAQRIIDYRRQHGMFRRVEDLDNVKGIGSAKLAEIKTLVTIKAQGGGD